MSKDGFGRWPSFVRLLVAVSIGLISLLLQMFTKTAVWNTHPA